MIDKTDMEQRAIKDARRMFAEVLNELGLMAPFHDRPATDIDRIIDLYAVSAAARAAVFTPRVAALLQAAFAEPAIAIQSLYFEYGSQQSIHQDTAYVVSRRPLGLAPRRQRRPHRAPHRLAVGPAVDRHGPPERPRRRLAGLRPSRAAGRHPGPGRRHRRRDCRRIKTNHPGNI